MTGYLKVGDTVRWRGGFGSQPATFAKVVVIEATKDGEEYGDRVEQIAWEAVTRSSCVVWLDNGHWAYGNQLEPVR